jgi:hypothetical protein
MLVEVVDGLLDDFPGFLWCYLLLVNDVDPALGIANGVLG